MTETILYFCFEVRRACWRLRCVRTFFVNRNTSVLENISGSLFQQTICCSYSIKSETTAAPCWGPLFRLYFHLTVLLHVTRSAPSHGSVLLPWGDWMRAAPAKEERVGEVALSCSISWWLQGFNLQPPATGDRQCEAKDAVLYLERQAALIIMLDY